MIKIIAYRRYTIIYYQCTSYISYLKYCLGDHDHFDSLTYIHAGQLQHYF